MIPKEFCPPYCGFIKEEPCPPKDCAHKGDVVDTPRPVTIIQGGKPETADVVGHNDQVQYVKDAQGNLQTFPHGSPFIAEQGAHYDPKLNTWVNK